MKRTEAIKIRQAIELGSVSLEDGVALEVPQLYKAWQSGVSYLINERLNYNGILYKVIQSHTSQSDWTPDIVPALFTVVSPAGVILDWVQPTGAQDAYNIGDKVLFNGNTYESIIDANVWSPTAYPAGWKLITT